MDRTIHFGDDAADARYRIQDTSSTGGDFVLAEDLDGGTVLLEYDYSASEWVSRGPVNLSGNDITNAGSISADTLEADSANVTTGVGTGRTWQDVTTSRSLNTTETNNSGADIEIIVNITVDTTGSVNVAAGGTTTLDRLSHDLDAGDDFCLVFSIPTGGDYSINDFSAADISIGFWKELRP